MIFSHITLRESNLILDNHELPFWYGFYALETDFSRRTVEIESGPIAWQP